MEYILMIPALNIIATVAEATAGMDPIALITQVVGVVTAVLGVLYGLREKRIAAKQGSQTIEKNTFDQLVEENKLLIKRLQLMRKDQDKWYLLRSVVLEQPQGPETVRKVEETADQISSNED